MQMFIIEVFEMVKFIRLFIAVILIIPFLLLVSIFALPINYLFKALKCNKFCYNWIQFWAKVLVKWIMFFLGAKVIVSGKYNIPSKGKKVCYIGNHQSMLDVVALLWAKGTRSGFIGKIEVKKVPVLNLWFDSLGCVYLDRKNPRTSIKSIIEGSKKIENGMPMGVFPEGTRSKDGQIHEFKHGSFKMGTRVGALIVPVTIRNTRKLLEEIKSFKIIKVYIDYGMPIDSSTLSEDEIKALPELVEKQIRLKADELDRK